jgi:Collagenase and related proteases
MIAKIPELLSPVGGRAQLEAAVNNGADAVYMGGSLFNARINAENFTEESLAEAIDWAHGHGVKTYITFNTLLKDSELDRAFRYACRLYEMGADALIIQDMGLARLVHKFMPDFHIHLSTQGTVYNVQALDLVKKLGFSRVVPARELSLEEIGAVCKEAHSSDALGGGTGKDPLEVEVFVHGALCMCYSGQCQMSRAFGGGGRSGNRGLCAQPCRLLYTDDKGRKGYFLSPKDLCALELMPQLIAAGVDSFKIEGRIKSAEYVAVTTAVYRKYLDIYAKMASRGPVDADEWKTIIDPADMERLKRSFNRGGFTTGYLEGNPGDGILSGESPKNQGVYIGTVTGTTVVKGKGRNKALVDVAGSDVSIGDGVEIRRTIDEATGAAAVTGSSVVTFARKQGKNAVRIGDFDRSVRTGDRAYKVTDKALREEALATPEKKLPVSMRFHAYAGREPQLEIRLKDKGRKIGPVRVQGAFAVEKAENRPLTEDMITARLMKLGGTVFDVREEDVRIETDQDIMIPVSVINSMRRGVAEELADALRGEARKNRRPLTEEKIGEAVEGEKLGDDSEVRRVESLAAEEGSDDKMPSLPWVTKGEADRYIEENFEALAEGARERGIMLGNLGWAKQFMDAGVNVYGDCGLNACNSQSIRAYEELGIKMLRLSLEMSHGGEIPLMITEHPFSTDYLIDRKGVRHPIFKINDKSVIF